MFHFSIALALYGSVTAGHPKPAPADAGVAPRASMTTGGSFATPRSREASDGLPSWDTPRLDRRPMYSSGDLSGDLAGTVSDSTNDAPLPGVEVSVERGTQIVANATTDAFGRYLMHDVPAGTYTVTAHFIGYRAKGAQITVAGTAVHVNFKLFPPAAALAAVQVTAQAPVAVNTPDGGSDLQPE